MNDMKDATIFIVDDVDSNITVAGSVLKQMGYRILFAKTGREAIENIKKYKPDLILLDIMMPGIDGFGVCENLKNIPETKDIPIIFLTAKNNIESITKGFRLGGVDYITKPFNMEELTVRIKTHLELLSKNRELERQRCELEKLNNTKDKFFSIIAHDLKGPFSGFITLSEVLNSRFEQITIEDLQELIVSLNSSAKLLNELLDNLLTWSQVQRGTIKFKPAPTYLKPVIDDVYAILSLNASKKEIVIKNNINEDCIVHTDENLVYSVLRNLLSNAIKYSAEKSEIIVSSIEEDENNYRITVKDSGVGIPGERLKTIFKIEQKSSTPGTNNEHGTGLGLIICYEFIVRQGGKIWIESEEGKGTEVHFTLEKGSLPDD